MLVQHRIEICNCQSQGETRITRSIGVSVFQRHNKLLLVTELSEQF
ncbi:hypothetical protein ABIE13_000230 [Ottowia thiooxydans]|uniref:Uncharacterized protein n=1 Tax=Ottowia thiooxydans TaxID=219182 RepID=A0ABV2Q2R2_9BURK